MKLYVITGACGSGKSTMKDALALVLDKAKYACVDADEVGLNWWDYREDLFTGGVRHECIRSNREKTQLSWEV